MQPGEIEIKNFESSKTTIFDVCELAIIVLQSLWNQCLDSDTEVYFNFLYAI